MLLNIIYYEFRAVSSAGEHHVDIVGVTGSNPVSTTLKMSKNINITLPDGSISEYPIEITGYDIAYDISKSLAKESVAILINNKMCDLNSPILEDSSIQIIKKSDDRVLDIIRHDCAHIMAQSAMQLSCLFGRLFLYCSTCQY